MSNQHRQWLKTDWWREERAARERGFAVIAGIDEAGRGPLAGPVVAACVVLPFGVNIPEVRDSKTLSASQRERAYDRINGAAISVGVGVADVDSIDTLNILRASHQAMRDSLNALNVTPDVALIDGLPVQPFPIPQIAIVKGDSRSASVAAASIIAKVTRDRIMVNLDTTYPQYGFASHKGYATEEHLACLRQHGPCPIHRRSFNVVSELLSQPALALDLRRQDTGRSGESIAAEHLRCMGWKLLDTRFHCRGGEIDIVAMDGAVLVFVEVKASRLGGSVPAASVDRRKRRRLVVAAETYMCQKALSESSCRFDVAEVRFMPDGFATVELIQNAFMAGE